MHVMMLLYPKLTQLDLTAPFEAFARSPEMKIDLVWKDRNPVLDALGLELTPTATFEEAPAADIVFVPGGPGQLALMNDQETLAYVRRQASNARFITSVCTGSLILAAAGLLQGYRATRHWMSLPQLSVLGAIPVQERGVIDGNRVTGAGVTSGIDFALVLAAELLGRERPKLVQLAMEYDPQPPFTGGSAAKADPEQIEALRASSAEFQARREVAAKQAADEMGRSTAE